MFDRFNKLDVCLSYGSSLNITKDIADHVQTSIAGN